MSEVGRRGLIVGAAGAVIGTAHAAGTVPIVDEGTVESGHVAFPSIVADSERPAAPLANPDPPARRVGFAILGLGRLALGQILPAFAACRHARPVALVSGDAAKMRTIAAQYGIAPSGCYGYADIARMRDNKEINVVYVVTPNALHRAHVVAAARAGKHVLCEKPMATSPDEAREMIAACRDAKRLLMIAYRCQYETYNAELARWARAGALGRIQLIDAVNVQNQGDPEQWRQKIALSGGGSLPDIGLYCLNTARALLGEEPTELMAASWSPPGDPRFREVEANISFTLRFPSGAMANCASSYAAHEQRSLRVFGADAAADLENAFAYEGHRLRIARRDGKADVTGEITLGRRNQFALEIDHMAECVRTGTTPRTPGEEGLQDHVLMAAIYESARTRRTVTLQAVGRRDAFRGPQPPEE